MRRGGLIFLALAGCAAGDGVRSRNPDFMIATSRARGEVAQCIARTWAGESALSVHRKVEAGRTTVIGSYGSGGGADIIADVTDDHVEMHRRRDIWGGTIERLRDAVTRCAQT